MRDTEYGCTVCGKYISYKDIPEKVEVEFTPDTEHTQERTEMTHKKCLELKEDNDV